jgi:MFS transporter, OCT family, solute carrier family 22 (organic cation transporter), member 18
MRGGTKKTAPTYLLLVYVNVVAYSICYMMQQPLLPYLMDHLGADTAQFALMQSCFNGAQALGGVLSGERLSAG